ncbi:unnamed protein product [Pylaiella littoralis]
MNEWYAEYHARKRCGLRQKAAKADLRGPKVIYRRLLVPESDTRRSWSISDANRARMPRCNLVYRFVARNHGGIPLSERDASKGKRIVNIFGCVKVFFEN